MKFKEKSCPNDIKVQDEAVSIDTEAAESSRRSRWVHESDHNKQQIFNPNMSSRTFIAGEEKSKPDFKASEGKLTLLLGAYAASDFNLKPMLFTILKILGPLRIMLNLLFLCSINIYIYVYIYIHIYMVMTDFWCCTAETNTTLQSNYPPIKN